MRRSWLRIATLVVVLCVGTLPAGCSAGRDNVSPKPSVSPLVLPSPTGAALSLPDAATRYLEIVDPHNAAMNELFAVEDADEPWTVQRQALAKIFQADETEILELAGTAWPAEVHPLIDRFVQVKLAHRQKLSDAVHATTEAEYFRLTRMAFAQAECQEANAVREVLGLDDAGGDCPTTVPA